MGSLTLQNISKSFGPVEVLKDINLEVESGEFVVFVGPSGCGKSTLLRIIAGLEDQTAGQVLIEEKPVDHLPPSKRGIAMVFQSYALYPHLTARGNMSLGLKQSGADRNRIAQQVQLAADMLSLESLLDRKPSELSGGQRQRVAIGRAIVREPTLFLFDEPLSNLDAALRVNTRIEIAKLHRTLNSTMVYVTHDQTEAMTLADKIVVLNEGRIEQVGHPLELYQRPANLFVAGFIGSPKMNFLSGDAAAAFGAVEIGIRPEHISLSRDSGSWKAVVSHAEHLGSDTFVYLEIEDHGLLTVRTTGETLCQPGESFFLTPNVEAIHRFDANGVSIGQASRTS
ncbi:ABC transporter ATP-binding protein [Denitrobaculum tricleocarpae]|uniref:ABC transporter ATP-binding protein n=1 Tax=Denitrobaculum tricleocarpae TaxID=2591009 RepID=A0A545U2J5_9PROT|nr:ABC transporter ATP-binding protein [Denitrobaculum tricleocarpae]TQV83676.1 ABC transporter ATP-binding protein [Denitrobaculum tricleocarpae]